MSNSKYNSVRRSKARGAKARGTTGTNDGSNAINKAKQSTKGSYITEFVRNFEKVSEVDVSLRVTYAKDLLSANVNVPSDMITLKPRAYPKQTLTSLDEVYYVKVGKYVYGKISIRVQRVRQHINLTFIYQKKKTYSTKKPKKHFSSTPGFGKRSKSQNQQSKRNSYNRRS